MLGLKQNTVALVPHDPAWKRVAAEECARIRDILGDVCIDCAHVGSTSIESICAKPIIDIAVGVDSFEKLPLYFDQMKDSGYIHREKNDNEWQLFFSKCGDAPDTRTLHIHVVIHGGREWRNYINFRDYIRSHECDAKKYEELKLRLCESFPLDRVSYTDGKAEFIERMLCRSDAYSYLGKRVEIGIDRPIGYLHRKGEKTLLYPINYGFLPGIIGGDGEELDVYVLGADRPLESTVGKIVGIVYREDDIEDKLIASIDNTYRTAEEMARAIEFQEKYYISRVEALDASEQIKNTNGENK